MAGLLKSSLGLPGVFAGSASILILDAMKLFWGCWVFLKRDLDRATVRNKAAAVRSKSLESSPVS